MNLFETESVIASFSLIYPQNSHSETLGSSNDCLFLSSFMQIRPKKLSAFLLQANV